MMALTVALGLAAGPAWLGAAATPEGLVRPGWHLVKAVARGDLDGDGRPEAALVIGPGEAETFGWTDPDGLPPRPRWLVVAARDARGRWRARAAGAHAVRRASEGGIYGDPFEAVTIARGALTVHHYGGSAWRWEEWDRYAWRGGALRRVASDYESTFTNDPGYRLRRCHDWATGRVSVAYQGYGRTAAERFREAWVPAGAPVPSLVLGDRDRVGDRGARGAVARLAFGRDARWLRLRADATGLGPGARLVLQDGRGRPVPPVGARRTRTAAGWRWEARYPLAALGLTAAVAEARQYAPTEPDDPATPPLVLRATVVVSDARGPRLATSAAPARYPGALRLVDGVGLPALGAADARRFEWLTDDRPVSIER